MKPAFNDLSMAAYSNTKYTANELVRIFVEGQGKVGIVLKSTQDLSVLENAAASFSYTYELTPEGLFHIYCKEKRATFTTHLTNKDYLDRFTIGEEDYSWLLAAV